jgi:chromosomal replication initiator protein
LDEVKQAWEKAVRAIADRQQGSLDLWLGQVSCAGIERNVLVLKVPNAFTREWISERYQSLILEKMKEALPEIRDVQFLLDSSAFERSGHHPDCARAQTSMHAQPAGPPMGSNVNPRFTFEEFVEGPCNRLAYAACKGLATGAETSFSPLFIYGPSGVGKTHLLNAIHHALGGTTPRGPVVYMPCESFMNDFLDSLKSGRMQGFRERYRQSCGMLLIDDIQFIAARERTQEEFFHIFNELYNTGRPVVMTSDRPPRELAKVEGRLSSRFEWGLMADVTSPEVETRIAIIRMKMASMGIELSRDVIELVAATASGSVREIEGALIRLDVQSGLERCPISIDLTQRALGFLARPSLAKLTADEVIREVASSYGLKVSDLKGTRRHRSVSLPRQVAMYLCREMLGLSYPEIGERLGGRDHTTVISGHRKVTGMLDSNATLQSSVDAIRRHLGRTAA